MSKMRFFNNHKQALQWFPSKSNIPSAMTELLETVRPIFLAAGWRSGRRVDVSAMVPSDHPASEILAEFGDLTVGDDGAGQEWPTRAAITKPRIAGQLRQKQRWDFAG